MEFGVIKNCAVVVNVDVIGGSDDTLRAVCCCNSLEWLCVALAKRAYISVGKGTRGEQEEGEEAGIFIVGGCGGDKPSATGDAAASLRSTIGCVPGVGA